MHRPRLAMALAAVAVLSIGSSFVRPHTAFAQAKTDFAAAKQHYLAAKNAEKVGDFETAAKEYIAAYDVTKDPKLLKQIGAMNEAAGKKPEAVIAYRRYLAEAKGAPDEADIKAKIALLEGSPAKPADDKAMGEAGKLPGPAVAPPVETAKPGAEALPPVDLLGGDEALEPAGVDQTPPQATQVIPPTYYDEGPRWQKTAAWASVGVAAALLTTGAVLGLSAQSREEDLQILTDFRESDTRLPKTYTGIVRSDYEDKVDEGESLDTYSQVAFVGAGVAAAAAVLFFVLDATSAPAEEAPATLNAFVAPGAAGVSAGWTF